MSTNRNLLTSPVGTIHWMAAATPVKDSKTGKANYSVKLEFDVKKDAKWLAQISEINEAKVVTATSYRGKSDAIKAVLTKGKALVEAKSKFQPEVYDAEGNVLEDIPLFFAESTGTAQMYVEPYVGEKGGTINLVGIKIHSISTPEGTSSSTGVDRETRLAQLRAMAKEDSTK